MAEIPIPLQATIITLRVYTGATYEEIERKLQLLANSIAQIWQNTIIYILKSIISF
jgi:hypothetical protein